MTMYDMYIYAYSVQDLKAFAGLLTMGPGGSLHARMCGARKWSETPKIPGIFREMDRFLLRHARLVGIGGKSQLEVCRTQILALCFASYVAGISFYRLATALYVLKCLFLASHVLEISFLGGHIC